MVVIYAVQNVGPVVGQIIGVELYEGIRLVLVPIAEVAGLYSEHIGRVLQNAPHARPRSALLRHVDVELAVLQGEVRAVLVEYLGEDFVETGPFGLFLSRAAIDETVESNLIS